MVVDSQALGSYWFKKYRRQNNFIKLLTDHLQNVQIQPGEELARQYKTIVSKDQCYVSIKLEEEEDDDDNISNMPTRCQREVVFLWGCKIVKVLQNICSNSTTSLVMSKLSLQLVVSHGDSFYRMEYDNDNDNDDFFVKTYCSSIEHHLLPNRSCHSKVGRRNS